MGRMQLGGWWPVARANAALLSEMGHEVEMCRWKEWRAYDRALSDATRWKFRARWNPAVASQRGDEPPPAADALNRERQPRAALLTVYETLNRGAAQHRDALYIMINETHTLKDVIFDGLGR